MIFFDKRPASPERQTKEVWIYDFRTNVHFTLRQHPMTDADLQDFIQCYHPENRHERTETWSQENPEGRWRRFTVDEILERDKTSLDIFWLKDKSLADLDNLPAPDELAADIIENLQSALESFQELMGQLKRTIEKYFAVCSVFPAQSPQTYLSTRIYDLDCPMWVLEELIGFGEFCVCTCVCTVFMQNEICSLHHCYPKEF